MNLYKLIGYNPTTFNYTNPGTGQIENLPSSAFKIADTTPATYELYDAPENWSDYAVDLIGTFTGLKDYLSFQNQICTRIEAIAGTDYVNWNNLSSIQKLVALVYCPIEIVDAKGMTFYVTECGSQEKATYNIDLYLDKANISRIKRYYNAFTLYGITYMGKLQGIKAENYARKDFLDSTYNERGVVFNSVAGIEGIGDWIQGISGYGTTGLKPRIIAGEFVLLGGIDTTLFCDTLVAILDEGIY